MCLLQDLASVYLRGLPEEAATSSVGEDLFCAQGGRKLVWLTCHSWPLSPSTLLFFPHIDQKVPSISASSSKVQDLWGVQHIFQQGRPSHRTATVPSPLSVANGATGVSDTVDSSWESRVKNMQLLVLGSARGL